MDKKFLPSGDRLYLDGKGFHYREINDGARNGLIIDHFNLEPKGKFNLEEVSLLIIIPSGYPDIHPDMFYCLPEIHLKNSNGFPPQAEVMEDHFGQKWQRWSRHISPDSWRPGIDGIFSYLQKIYTALRNC
jgi:hypothetical protein